MKLQERVQNLPPDKRPVQYFILTIFLLWLFVTFFLFLSGEAIFILPAFFIGSVLIWLRIYFSKRFVILETLIYFVLSLLPALFSYLSANDSATRPYFTILCLFVALIVLFASWRRNSFFYYLQVCVWLSCMAVVFFFGLWPIGLIAISASVLLSITINLASPYLAHLFIADAGSTPKNVKLSAPAVQKLGQQEVRIPQPAYDTLVPGQQYQEGLLSEYDSSFGPYIQDLPRE